MRITFISEGFNISNNNYLFIAGPPTAERKEITKIVRMGDTLKLQCPMNGSPPMQFDWTKDNEQIKPYAWPR